VVINSKCSQQVEAGSFVRCEVLRWDPTNGQFDPSSKGYDVNNPCDQFAGGGCEAWLTGLLSCAAGTCPTFSTPHDWTSAETADKAVTACNK
jgi:hypothetical protein